MEKQNNQHNAKINQLILQRFLLLNLMLVISSFILKLIDIFVSIVGLYLGAGELNFLGFLFKTNPALLTIISFIFIIILLVLVVILRDDFYSQKYLLVTSITFNLILFLCISSNLIVLMGLL